VLRWQLIEGGGTWASQSRHILARLTASPAVALAPASGWWLLPLPLLRCDDHSDAPAASAAAAAATLAGDCGGGALTACARYPNPTVTRVHAQKTMTDS
jgi:hypothetical protein